MILVVPMLLSAAASTVAADRGMVAPGPVSVWEPGQKAIIAWNGEREVMILSTDVYASENTWALEIMPFPSLPEVEAGDFNSFVEIQNLVNKYAGDAFAKRGVLGEAPIEVVFHQRIGAHDITAVRANDALELIDWAENFLTDRGLAQGIAFGGLENLAARYIRRGVNYWVFDLIDLDEGRKSVEPLLYSFESDFLYYPLEISSLASGTTEITLFCLTRDRLDARSVRAAGFDIESFEVGQENVALELSVSIDELQRIGHEVAELFGDNAWLTVLTHRGPLADLSGDLVLVAAPGAEADNLLAAAWAAMIICGLLIAFAIIYRVSPYYKLGPA
ncbi:MAG: DUF2330 domain-containing protein [Candidatus Hodarchaeaceae archaeon]|nr:DUF2330 domain-containing protein [Candidatus Hodarchaeaceae archaeon]